MPCVAIREERKLVLPSSESLPSGRDRQREARLEARSGWLFQVIHRQSLAYDENDTIQSHSQSWTPHLSMSTLPEMMLLPSLMKSMLWQVMLGTVIRSSSLLDSVCHTLMSLLAQVANSSAVPLKRTHQGNMRCSHRRCRVFLRCMYDTTLFFMGQREGCLLGTDYLKA